MTETKINKIQIYGERCTGTNYLEKLVEKNLKNVKISWDFGWKHFYHQNGVEQADNYLFIVLYRNPFDWIRSLYKTPWHTAPSLRNISFSQFIRQEWHCVWDEHAEKHRWNSEYGTEMMFERDPLTQQRHPNVLKMRTSKILNWESLKQKTQHHLHLTYEQLKQDPEGFVQQLSSQFGIATTSSFKPIKGFKGGLIRYKPKQYVNLDADDHQFILDQLNIELEEQIGYDPMHWQQH